MGETLQPLRSAADVARLARTIELTRTAVGHLLNARSSRSHCLVHLHLTEQVALTPTPTLTLTLTLALTLTRAGPAARVGGSG